jgi:hypothetical protein
MTEVSQRPSSLSGQLRFIRYGFMPNLLRYCGGDDNRALFDYGIAGVTDGGLTALLRQFSGALPYLTLIARANGLTDPFDDRVVEAYWLGNELLEGVEASQLHNALAERINRHLTGRARAWLLGKAPAGARPHHSFHVFDVHSRIGDQGHSLRTMDQCRVSWGRVVQVEAGELVVLRRPLLLIEGKLVLGPPREERVTRQVDGHGFADAAAPGDDVSLHWSWVCETITPVQCRNLERYTAWHLTLANQTL